MFNSYTPGINTSIIPKWHYDNIFSEKTMNELHAWIKNHPNIIYPPNIKDWLFVKINVTIVNKQNHLLQISVQDLHNDMILPLHQGVFWVQEQLKKKYVLEIRYLGSTC